MMKGRNIKRKNTTKIQRFRYAWQSARNMQLSYVEF